MVVRIRRRWCNPAHQGSLGVCQENLPNRHTRLFRWVYTVLQSVICSIIFNSIRMIQEKLPNPTFGRLHLPYTTAGSLVELSERLKMIFISHSNAKKELFYKLCTLFGAETNFVQNSRWCEALYNVVQKPHPSLHKSCRRFFSSPPQRPTHVKGALDVVRPSQVPQPLL